IGAPAHGVLTGTAPNLTYMPDAGFSGTDSFEFTVSDGRFTSAVATVEITVPAPVVTVTGDLPPGGEITVAGSGLPGGIALDVELHSDPVALGAVQAAADGTFTVTATLPATVPAGAHTVVVLLDGVEAATAAVTVAAAPVVEEPVVEEPAGQEPAGEESAVEDVPTDGAGVGEALPAAGGEPPYGLAALASALLLAGVLLVLRRRRVGA